MNTTRVEFIEVTHWGRRLRVRYENQQAQVEVIYSPCEAVRLAPGDWNSWEAEIARSFERGDSDKVHFDPGSWAAFTYQGGEGACGPLRYEMIGGVEVHDYFEKSINFTWRGVPLTAWVEREQEGGLPGHGTGSTEKPWTTEACQWWVVPIPWQYRKWGGVLSRLEGRLRDVEVLIGSSIEGVGGDEAETPPDHRLEEVRLFLLQERVKYETSSWGRTAINEGLLPEEDWEMGWGSGPYMVHAHLYSPTPLLTMPDP